MFHEWFLLTYLIYDTAVFICKLPNSEYNPNLQMCLKTLEVHHENISIPLQTLPANISNHKDVMQLVTCF